LSDHLDLKKNIDATFNTNQPKTDPYEGVTCHKTFFYFKKTHWFRLFCTKVCAHPKFESIILVLIILSSIKLVVGTYYRDDELEANDPQIYKIFNYIDISFNVSFTIECVLKIMKFGFVVSETSYLRDSWSILDFTIVVTSLLDMSLDSINLPILKVIRLLRTLRPLRFISQNQNMRIVVNGLLKSMAAILNVLIVIGMVFVMFAILGNNLMGGKMQSCNVASDQNFSPYLVSATECTTIYNGTMRTFPSNFDDIGQSMVTLFILTTMEGWPDILGAAMDASDPDTGPDFMNSTTNGIFFIVFILVGSLFLMNMFVGVIFVQFTEEQRIEKQKRFHMVTDDQMRWMMVQDITVSAEPNFDLMTRPKGKIRLWVFKFMHSKAFEIGIMFIIILNIATMAMSYEFMSDQYISMLSNINLGFTAIFAMEFAVKIVALDFQYFTTGWNVFDFTIVMLSLLDVLVSLIGSGNSKNPILSQAPQIAKMLRVLRVSRLFKLMKAKQLKGVNKIVKTIVFSFPSLMNVMVLLLLVYFIFSVLAVFLFSGTMPHDDNYNSDLFNFDNFHMAMITLFRCSTGENWPQFMFYFGSTGSWSDSLKSKIFFVLFIFLSYTVMLQVFQLVVMQQFDEYYFNSDNPINSFDEAEEMFRKTWNQFTIKTRGTKIKSSRIVQFFYYLE
jgi:Ion transport protein